MHLSWLLKKVACCHASDNFTVALLRLMGYESCRCSVEFNVPFFFFFNLCGVYCDAPNDVCVMDEDGVSRLILKIKRDVRYPLEEMVADAIAAFECNNNRRRSVGGDQLTDGIIPAIVIMGTIPTFLKTSFSRDLVRLGQGPNVVTKVFKDSVESPIGRSAGMFHPANRFLFLQCFEAFKAIVFPPPQTFSEILLKIASS
jgi:hypothetical protein